MFEDIVQLDDRSVQLVMRKVDTAASRSPSRVSRRPSATRSPRTSPSVPLPTSSTRSRSSARSASPRSRRPSRASSARSASSRSRASSWSAGGTTMTSSSESRVLRADQAGSAYAMRTPDLRGGNWTRLGSGAVLGDVVTEDTLSALAERTRASARGAGVRRRLGQGRPRVAGRRAGRPRRARGARAPGARPPCRRARCRRRRAAGGGRRLRGGQDVADASPLRAGHRPGPRRDRGGGRPARERADPRATSYAARSTCSPRAPAAATLRLHPAVANHAIDAGLPRAESP